MDDNYCHRGPNETLASLGLPPRVLPEVQPETQPVANLRTRLEVIRETIAGMFLTHSSNDARLARETAIRLIDELLTAHPK